MANIRTVSNQMTKAEMLRQRLYIESQQDGANPSQLLELLETIVNERIWEQLDPPISFVQLIEEAFPIGIGLTREEVKAILKLHHKSENRNPETLEEEANNQHWLQVRQAVLMELNPELPKHGEIGNGRDYIVISTPTDRQGNSTEYTIRRLRRDNPDLAEQVIKGEISANKAAIMAGFRKRSITILLEPIPAARALLRHFNPDELRQLLEYVESNL